jgi:hypothetical protein
MNYGTLHNTNVDTLTRDFTVAVAFERPGLALFLDGGWLVRGGPDLRHIDPPTPRYLLGRTLGGSALV